LKNVTSELSGWEGACESSANVINHIIDVKMAVVTFCDARAIFRAQTSE
jgi:hypothetical protein